jgi:hypothetical protein
MTKKLSACDKANANKAALTMPAKAPQPQRAIPRNVSIDAITVILVSASPLPVMDKGLERWGCDPLSQTRETDR